MNVLFMALRERCDGLLLHNFFTETESYRCYMYLILSPFFSELTAIEKMVTSCKTVVAKLLKLLLREVSGDKIID